jgi:mitochondrial fission protein ELM1
LTARAVLWTVTDGRAGIEAQALGLAEAIARRTPAGIIRKRINVRAPFSALPRAAWGDPFTALDREGDTISPPWPDLWIGCGRLSVPFSMAVKERAPDTFVVQIQNPRAPLGAFDLVVAPSHDAVTGANVFPILGSPNRIDATALLRPIAPGLAPVAVLIGGPNKAFRFDDRDGAAIAARLVALEMPLDVTLSRRTPRAAAQALREKLGAFAARFYDPSHDGAGANPYPAMLGAARAIIVTEDSVNMAAEAAATGRPLYVMALARKPFASARKFDAFHAELRERGAARVFSGAIETWDYAPLDETSRAAEEILRRWRR